MRFTATHSIATMRMRHIGILAGALALSAATAHAQTITPIGTWGPSSEGDISFATAVNADGTVAVGYSTALSGRRAMRWTPAFGISDLGVVAGYNGTFSSAVSADGNVVVGRSYIDSSTFARAFVWTFSAGMSPILPDPSYAIGVSADGTVVCGTHSFFSTLFRWTSGGGVQDLGKLTGALNSLCYGISGDGSTIFGLAQVVNGAGDHAFKWTQAGGIVDLGVMGPGLYSWALAASYDGSTIVGSGSLADNFYVQPMRWTGAGIEYIGTPPNALGAQATAVSAEGTVIAGDVSGFENITNDAWIWTQTRGFVYLHDYLPSEGVNIAGWTSFDYCSAISADGTALVGHGYYQGLSRGFVVRGLPPVCGPWITEPPQSTVGCSGGQVTLSVTAYGPTFAPAAFQWHKLIGGFWIPLSNGPLGGGTLVSGANSPSGVLTLSNCSADAVGVYTVEVIAGCGSRATSPVQVTLIDQTPLITVHPVNTSVCDDGSASFSITPPAPANGPYTYQWERETSPNVFVPLTGGYTMTWDGNLPGIGGIVTGALTPTMTIAAATGNGLTLSDAHALAYRCVVSNACGSTASDPASLKVWSSCDTADMNGDHVIDFFDIDPFLLLLFDPDGFAAAYSDVNPLNADVNHDDVVDFFDIDPFLDCLFGACP